MQLQQRRAIARYGVGMLAVLAVLGLKLALVRLVTQETPFLLFFGAVVVAGWYGGLGPGLMVTAFSALLSDFFFIPPFYRFEMQERVQWLKMAMFLCEGTFISILCAMMNAARQRAEQNAEQVRALQQRILEVSEREQQKIGRDLHDGLGQHLTGIAFLSKRLAKRLSAKSLPEAEDASQIEKLVNDATRQARDLASGLSPVAIDAGGLASALQSLASETESVFRLRCTFLSAPVDIGDVSVAMNLYRIAQEAVTNAIKHGHAANIAIELAVRDGDLALTVSDDGVGFPASPAAPQGMGLQSMKYRAQLIGASVNIRRGGTGGTVVTCTWPCDGNRETRGDHGSKDPLRQQQ
jgi:signal transduction histidine kinase